MPGTETLWIAADKNLDVFVIKPSTALWNKFISTLTLGIEYDLSMNVNLDVPQYLYDSAKIHDHNLIINMFLGPILTKAIATQDIAILDNNFNCALNLKNGNESLIQ
jgi:hypothetical protein